MINRRNFMCGCSALFFLGGQTVPGFGYNQFDSPCGITKQDFEALTKNSQLSSAIPLEDKYKFGLVESLGNRTFENIFSDALVDVANAFKVYPDFRYYKDFGSPNALATPFRLRRNQHKSDGTILLGIEFFRNAMKHKGGDVGVLAVCAHEFGHIVGFKRNLREHLADAGIREFAFELHADFLTGYFLKKYMQRYPALDIDGVVPVWKKFGSKNFKRPGTHGTVKMRRRAISAGFFLAQNQSSISFNEAYEAATAHVSQYKI